MSMETLFEEYRAKPIRAVRVTAENAEELSKLAGIEFRPETDEEEMRFGVRVGDRYTQGISFGDWISEAVKPGLWVVYWGDEREDDPFSEFSRFSDVFEV